MKSILLFFVLAIASFGVNGQDQQVTTFIIVRHGEKVSDGSKDPELAPKGSERAERLAAMLSNVSINAVYSTNYKRTRNTIGPLAKAKALDVQSYESIKPADADEMLKKYRGGTIVIAGHSNTVPGIVNLLTGKDQFKDLEDSEYGNFFVVSVVERGKVTAVTRLQY